MSVRKQAIRTRFSFPPHLTNASALRGETWNLEAIYIATWTHTPPSSLHFKGPFASWGQFPVGILLQLIHLLLTPPKHKHTHTSQWHSSTWNTLLLDKWCNIYLKTISII